MMKQFFRAAVFFALLCTAFPFAAQSEGARLFKANKPHEAIPLLEKELSSGRASPDIYNYLGLAYYQTGQHDKSLSVFEQGLNVAGTDKKVLAYNAGNAAFAARNYEKAESCYSLALAASPGFAQAQLNRANARLNANKLQGALDDYVAYLGKVRNDPQQGEIERMIALLRAELVRKEEEARMVAVLEQQRQEEEARFRAEQERIALEKARQEAEARAEQERIALEKARQEAEARAEQERIALEKARQEAEARAAEEARRRKMLEDLANSLQDTNAESMTSGAEGALDYESELELD